MGIIRQDNDKGTFLNIKGRAIWPKLTKPDTKFKAEGEYSSKLALSPEDADEMREILEEFQEAAVQMAVEDAAKKGKKLNPDKVKRADLPLVELLDKETGEGTGEYAVGAKVMASGTRKDGSAWAKKLNLFDGKLRLIKNPENLDIWSGSILALRVQVRPFYVPALGAGVSLRLQAAQILKLNSGGDVDPTAMGFDAEEDGWCPDEYETDMSGGHEATSTASDDAGPEDF